MEIVKNMNFKKIKGDASDREFYRSRNSILVYSKKNKSYGTTTLQGKHIKVKNKNEIIIDFNGKKNVRNVCTVKNKKLVKTLKQKKRTINKEDRIFTYRKGEKYYNIKSQDVNKYLKQFGKFTAKDFRTWGQI